MKNQTNPVTQVKTRTALSLTAINTCITKRVIQMKQSGIKPSLWKAEATIFPGFLARSKDRNVKNKSGEGTLHFEHIYFPNALREIPHISFLSMFIHCKC